MIKGTYLKNCKGGKRKNNYRKMKVNKELQKLLEEECGKNYK